MEIFGTTYACSRAASARGLGLTSAAHVGAPFAAGAKGTAVSTRLRDTTVAPVAPVAAATALLPITDVVVDDVAGTRTWSPPV